MFYKVKQNVSLHQTRYNHHWLHENFLMHFKAATVKIVTFLHPITTVRNIALCPSVGRIKFLISRLIKKSV